MNERTERASLGDVLDAYVAATDEPTSASLVEWIRRYPEYEQELTDFAVAWSRMERLPAAERSCEVDQDTLVLRGMSIFQNILHRKEAERTATEQSLDGIVAMATQRGLSLAALAKELELNPALTRKLDLRRFVYARIPDRLKAMVASAVGCSRAAVEDYLRRPSAFAPGAQHRADRPPALPGQEDFFDAIRTEPNLSEDWRRRWLALEPPRGRENSQ